MFPDFVCNTDKIKYVVETSFRNNTPETILLFLFIMFSLLYFFYSWTSGT